MEDAPIPTVDRGRKPNWHFREMSALKIEETPNQTKSKSCRILPGFPELITVKDAKKLVEKTFGPNANLIDYTIGTYSDEKIGFLGSHQRLVVTVKKNSNDNSCPLTTIRFFVKALPYDVPTQAEYVREKGVFDQETFFFEHVVPELLRDFESEPWAPECYIIKKDCLVFEELGIGGFRMNGEKLLGENEIKAGLGALARLHGASLHAEARLGRPLNEIYPQAFLEKAFMRRGNQYRWYLAGVDVATKLAEMAGLDASKIAKACEHVFEAVKPSSRKKNVASHGDLWSNNLMFDDSRPVRCRLVDFQLARYSPLAHDIAQFLYLCSSRAFRDIYSTEMLQYYHECLKNSLEANPAISVPVPAFEEIKEGYEEQKLGALVTAIMYFPTVLLDGMVAAKIMNDPKSYENFVMHDRRDTVIDNMNTNALYRRRIDEVIRELVEMSSRLDELPMPR